MVVTDHWNYLLSSGVGEVVYDACETTLYRQHSENVIGYGHNFFTKLSTRIKRVFTGKPKENTRQLEAFFNCYSDVIKEDCKKELESFLSSQKNVFKRVSYLFKTRTYRQTAAETLIFRLMYFFGRYQIKTQKQRRQFE